MENQLNHPLPGSLKECHLIPTPRKIAGLENKLTDVSGFLLESVPEFSDSMEKIRNIFGADGTKNGKITLSCKKFSESDDAYSIVVMENSILVEAGTPQAACYAVETLKQIRVGTFLPLVTVFDYPELAIRGLHTHLGAQHQIGREEIHRLIDDMGKFKLNTFLLEYVSRFPFSGAHARLRRADAFTEEDVAKIEQMTESKYIEIIPLIQSFGHNEYISQDSTYRHLFEPSKTLSQGQFCPQNPDSFQLFTELASQILAAHPNGKYLHVGGDETRDLGRCPKCAEYVKEHGVGKLYIQHMNKVADWVVKQGRIPIIWDDMLSHYPEVIDELSRDFIIMYWDYWTTSSEKTPIWVARSAGRGIVCDSLWEKRDYIGLDEPERTILKGFAAKVDVEALLEGNAGKFKKYLGDSTPEYFSAFPYYEFFQEHGFRVIGAPTTLGNTVDDIYGLPNYARFRKNIRAFSRKCVEKQGLGLVTSSWYDFPVQMLGLGVIDTAQNSWANC